jgi:protein-tyrosine phosphatase
MYGVDELFKAYQKAGFSVLHRPILDQGVCTRDEMISLANWLDLNLSNGAKILLHCAGGLGRSGLVAASYLKFKGMKGEDAILAVRTARSSRALENSAQEEFVHNF